MAATPRLAVPLLAARLSPASAPPVETLKKLLADLDNDRFQTRQTAFKQLADLGELAEAALQETLKADASAEKRRRVEQLLSAPRTIPSPEQLRAIRAVEILERIGNAEAKRVLDGIAKGAPPAQLTREAQSALDRLGHR
jgi:hypothetical protein